jgi:hypothetical protein
MSASHWQPTYLSLIAQTHSSVLCEHAKLPASINKRYSFFINMIKKPPLKAAVTGAAGQIGYSLLFRIASGSMLLYLGPNQPAELRLIEIPSGPDGAPGSRDGVGRLCVSRRGLGKNMV